MFVLVFLNLYYAAFIEQFITNSLRSIVFMNQFTKEKSIKSLPSLHTKFRNIKITTYDNIKIGAYLIAPYTTDINTKYVIMLHGNNTNRKTFTKDYALIEKSNEENLVMLVPDYRDFGDSAGYFEMSTVVYDIDACMKFMKDLSNNKPIYLISHSLGTAIALEYMKHSNTGSINYEYQINNLIDIFETDEDYKYKVRRLYRIEPSKVVLISTFRVIDDIIKHTINGLDFIKNSLDDVDGFFDRKLGIDNRNNIRFVSKDILFVVHSVDDELIPFESAASLVEIIGASIHAVKDASHSQTFSNDKTWKLMMAFICSLDKNKM